MIKIILIALFITSMFSKSFIATGYGNNEKIAKDNALKNLSDSMIVKIKSSINVRKISNKDTFEVDVRSKLNISSDIILPQVKYNLISKSSDLFTVQAKVFEKDIISYMKNSKILLDNLNFSNEMELNKALKEIENIEKLFSIVKMKNQQDFIKNIKNHYKKINTLLYDGVLIVPHQKGIKISINNQLTNANKIFLESEKIHFLKASKKGYFPIEKKIYLRSQQNKTMTFDFIKNKKRNINFLFDYDYIYSFLKEYKITHNKKSKISFKVFYDIKEIEKKSYLRLSVNGVLLLKIKKKSIKISHSSSKTCRMEQREKCLKIIKKKIASILIKKALKRIDENEIK